MSDKLNKKLDKVLEAISMLTSRIDNLEKTLLTVGARIDELEKKSNEKFEDIHICLNSKTDKDEVEELKIRLSILEEKNKQLETTAVMKESYEKRFNILIHGIPENSDNPWEAPIETLDRIHNFMNEGLKISNPMAIQLADYHRLPQRPLFKDGVRVNRPIIIKLMNAADKRHIFANVKHLKSYNQNKKMLNHSMVYITDHLPKLFQEERKLLMPYFKKANSLKKKTIWRAENGHYYLYVDNVKVDIPTISDDKSCSSTNDIFP